MPKLSNFQARIAFHGLAFKYIKITQSFACYCNLARLINVDNSMKNMFLLFFILLCTKVHALNAELGNDWRFILIKKEILQSSHPADTSYLYEYDMKYVGSNSSVDPNYRYVLEHLVEMLKKDTSLQVHVRGHVCCGPSYRLSKKRACKVYRFLKNSGIHKDRLSFKGYSDSAPLAFPEETEEDEAKNRRVDFIITLKTH